MNTIQSSWQDFKKACIPSDTPEDHIASARKCFYAGAASMLNMAAGMPESDAAADAIMRGWIDEAATFVNENKE